MRPLRIAQVAPLYDRVPPLLYGGTERTISYLTEELVRLGQDVTLFASDDSVTSAHLFPGFHKSLKLHPLDRLANEYRLLEQVFQHAEEFDILHFHTEYLHFLGVRRQPTPHVTTLHGRLDLPGFEDLFTEFSDIPVVSISDNQRLPLPNANWQSTIYHGLPERLYTFHERPREYLAFLGRISPEKGVDRAIRMARLAERKLIIAGKIDALDRDYYHYRVKPLLKDPRVEYIGEIGDREKNDLLGNALALLFPITWPEPFGIVVIEAMACGTPVIASPRGAVPEIVEQGVTGFFADNPREAARAVTRVPELDRRMIRAVFERRFSARRMALHYLSVYRKLAVGAPQRSIIGQPIVVDVASREHSSTVLPIPLPRQKRNDF